MGSYFKIVNVTKRQYLDPSDFGEAIKWSSVLHGEHCIEALKHLLSDSHAVREKSKPWDIAGSWSGNSIVLTGDDTSPPDPIGIATSTNDEPGRNLNQLAAEEFQNISNLAIAMLAEHGFEQPILDYAENDNCMFLTIADFIAQTSDSRLKAAFEYRFKTNWRKRYNEIVAERTWHKPIPVPTET